jgi:hypothetical protein
MLLISEVSKEFENLSGLSKSEILNWMHLITKSTKDIESMIDSTVDINKVCGRLYYAAAALAYYRYIVQSITQQESVDYISAGDIKISHRVNANILDIARELKDDAISSLDDLKRQNTFIFKSV